MLNNAAPVPQAETMNQNPDAIDPANAQTMEIPNIAGTKRRLMSQLTAPLLFHTLAAKNKHKSTRQVAVATG